MYSRAVEALANLDPCSQVLRDKEAQTFYH